MAGTIHCAIHDVDETIPANAFIVCFECSHVYETDKALEEAWKEFVKGLPVREDDKPSATRKADYIFFCPLCLHDF